MKAKLELFGLVFASALAAAAFMATLVLIPGSSRGASEKSWLSAGEVCVDEQDLIAWMRSPPGAVPSTEIFMMLAGEHAEVFLQLTNGSSLATEPRVLYLYHAPDSLSEVLFAAAAAVADSSGCLIKMDGTRAASPTAGFAGITMTIRRMCSVLAAAGARHWNRCSNLSGMPNGLLNGPASWERSV